MKIHHGSDTSYLSDMITSAITQKFQVFWFKIFLTKFFIVYNH